MRGLRAGAGQAALVCVLICQPEREEVLNPGDPTRAARSLIPASLKDPLGCLGRMGQKRDHSDLRVSASWSVKWGHGHSWAVVRLVWTEPLAEAQPGDPTDSITVSLTSGTDGWMNE